MPRLRTVSIIYGGFTDDAMAASWPPDEGGTVHLILNKELWPSFSAELRAEIVYNMLREQGVFDEDDC